MSSSSWDTLQKRLDGLKRPTATFTICEDAEVRQRLNRARAAEREARQILDGLTDDDQPQRPLFEERATTAAAELDAAQQAFKRVSVTLTFQALERKALADLEKAHPAEEQAEAAGEDFAMESFAPALIAAASVDGMPVDYARHCLDTWSSGDAGALFAAAWSVQNVQRTDLGKG